MAATHHEQRFVVLALMFSLVAIAAMVTDKILNPDIVNRQTFDVLQLVFSVIALVCGVIIIVQARRRPKPDDSVIDLRERLGGHVDLDDVEVDRALHGHH